MPYISLTENRLYHYCCLETAKNYILPTNNLLLSNIVNTNDPRENKHFTFRSESKGMTNDEITIKNSEVNALLKKNCKTLCFSQDYKGKWGCASSQMWAHYGDKHRGICLELDKKAFIKENPHIDWSLFKNVKYVNHKIPKISDKPNDNPFNQKTINYISAKKAGFENYVLNVFRKKHLDYFYFTKNKEWESEREIRIIHFGDDSIKEFCSIKGSLRNIHLGIKFDDAELPSIQKLVSGIDFYKMDYAEISLYSQPLSKNVV